MKVPNAAAAVIDERKLLGYLLSSSHPVGRYKARFFTSLGYDAENAQELASQLRAVLVNDVSEAIANDYGIKYVVQGRIEGADGTRADVVTVWIVLAGERGPRLVTAYPGGSG